MIYAIEEYWREGNSFIQTWECFRKKQKAIDCVNEWHHDNEKTYFKIVKYTCNRVHNYKWHNKEKKIVDYYHMGRYEYSIPTLDYYMELLMQEKNKAKRKLMVKYVAAYGTDIESIRNTHVECVGIGIKNGKLDKECLKKVR